jgi:hypothetical protein
MAACLVRIFKRDMTMELSQNSPQIAGLLRLTRATGIDA